MSFKARDLSYMGGVGQVFIALVQSCLISKKSYSRLFNSDCTILQDCKTFSSGAEISSLTQSNIASFFPE
jgi:hypothetical protein